MCNKARANPPLPVKPLPSSGCCFCHEEVQLLRYWYRVGRIQLVSSISGGHRGRSKDKEHGSRWWWGGATFECMVPWPSLKRGGWGGLSKKERSKGLTLACLLGPFVFELHFLLILKDPLLISEEIVLEHSVLRDPHLVWIFWGSTTNKKNTNLLHLFLFIAMTLLKWRTTKLKGSLSRFRRRPLLRILTKFNLCNQTFYEGTIMF